MLDDRAWHATLAERRLHVNAFRHLDEEMHGTGDLADQEDIRGLIAAQRDAID